MACLILLRTASLVTWSLYDMHKIFRKHLISMACILFCRSAERVHVSEAYRKMDMTRERISHQPHQDMTRERISHQPHQDMNSANINGLKHEQPEPGPDCSLSSEIKSLPTRKVPHHCRLHVDEAVPELKALPVSIERIRHRIDVDRKKNV